jgi:hypothetical protein
MTTLKRTKAYVITSKAKEIERGGGRGCECVCMYAAAVVMG